MGHHVREDFSLKRPISYKHFTLPYILYMSFTTRWIQTITSSSPEVCMGRIVYHFEALEVYFPTLLALRHFDSYIISYSQNYEHVSRETREVKIYLLSKYFTQPLGILFSKSQIIIIIILI